MITRKLALAGALLLGTSVLTGQAFAQGGDGTAARSAEIRCAAIAQLRGHLDILEYKALPQYHEPQWVTDQFVKTGKLPPVQDRLPKEPLVYKTANEPDGTGVYGDVMRHVIGGRPQGWNYAAGQIQGWGGTDIGMFECLTRTGPLFEVKADQLEPMPNLAKSWIGRRTGTSSPCT